MATAVPDNETARYDRSLRLWGADAQRLLSSAHVVLLGATSTGCEVIKNLVLPGLGSFTIVDERTVTRRDLGNNFFLKQQDEGRNRAEAVVPVLAELNPHASGRAVASSIASCVRDGSQLVSGSGAATLIVATSEVPMELLKSVSQLVAGKHIPLVYAACNGMIGVIRTQADPTFVLHTMPGPDTKVHDLRAINPFPSLEEWFERLDPATTTEHHEFAHIPWPCIVHHALKQWRAANAGASLPRTGVEWKAVGKIVEGYARYDETAKREKLLDNYIDARDNCSMRIDVRLRNTPELNALLGDPRAAKPTASDDQLWFLVHGLRRFREAHDGAMPVNGTLPDFGTTTAMYRELQQLFKQEATANANEIGTYAREAMSSAGIDTSSLSDDLVHEFSRQAWELSYVTFPPIDAEFSPGAHPGLSFPLKPESIRGGLSQALKWYACHRASLIVASKTGKAPGSATSPDDVTKSVADAEGLLDEALRSEVWPNAPQEMTSREVKEWVRFGGSEIITIASIVGATASQECIKLIQRRRRPASHTLIYDGFANFYTTIGDA